MHLLLFLNKSVVLRDTTQRQLVHQIDLVRRVHVLVLEILDNDREGSTEQHHLPIFGVESKELFDDGSELGGQELISFIHNECLARCEIGHALARKIQNPAWCSNNDVNWFAQSDDIVLEPCSTSGDHDVDTEVFSQSFADLRSLQCQFSSRYKNERLCLRVLRVYALKGGNNEGCGFSSAVLRSRKDVSSCQGNRDGLFLNWRGLLEACLEDSHHKLALDEEVLKLKSLGRGYVLMEPVSLQVLRMNVLCSFRRHPHSTQKRVNTETGRWAVPLLLLTSVCGRASFAGAVSPSFQLASDGASFSLVAASWSVICEVIV